MNVAIKVQTNEAVRLPVVHNTSIANAYEMRLAVQAMINESKKHYKDIGRLAEVSPQTVSHIADGTTKDPRSRTLLGILFALGGTLTLHR